jgi:hypothetical protein
MRPIVYGLEEHYSDQMTFIEVNALDGENGETAFSQSHLQGHPAFMIVQPDGKELFRSVGEQPSENLDRAIQSALSP